MQTIEDEVLDVLKECSPVGTAVYLPDRQLPRDLYTKVAKRLEGIGGKWNRSAEAFVFTSDPAELLAEIQGGEKRNLKKEFQFFVTPVEIINRCLELVSIKAGDLILEPSAGNGAFLYILKGQFSDTVKVEYCELMPQNCEAINKLNLGDNFRFIAPDFLTADIHEERYDIILANPPFNKNQDIIHLMRMYTLLKQGGTMVCITSISWLYGSQKLHTQFKNWLSLFDHMTEEQVRIFTNTGIDCGYTDASGDSIRLYMLDADTFKEAGANVRSCIVVIHKS